MNVMEVRELVQNKVPFYVSPNGWVFELSRGEVNFSRTEGRGQKKVKVEVHTVSLVNDQDVPNMLTYQFLSFLFGIHAAAEIAPIVEQYRAEVSKYDISAKRLPRHCAVMMRGTELIDYARPPIKGGQAGKVAYEVSELDFSITNLDAKGQPVLHPDPSISRRAQATALYDQIMSVPASERTSLSIVRLSALLKQAGVNPSSYYAQG